MADFWSPVWFYFSEELLIIWLSNLSILSVPIEGYARKKNILLTNFDIYVFTRNNVADVVVIVW